MSHPIDIRRLSPQQQAALMDAARQRALAARREAIDRFWADIGRAFGRARLSLRRRWMAHQLRSHGAV